MKTKELTHNEFIKLRKHALNQKLSPFAKFALELQGYVVINKKKQNIPKHIVFWGWGLKTKKAIENNVYLKLKKRLVNE